MAPDRLPRDIWGWGYIQRNRPDDWRRVTERFPLDIARLPSILGVSLRDTRKGVKGEDRNYVDDWGAVWRSLQAGVSGEVENSPLADWGALADYRPPLEMLEHPAEVSVAEACDGTECFRLGEIGAGPFERMQILRGVENLFLDLAAPDENFRTLLDMVHDFYLQHYSLWCLTGADAVAMGDDWGSQKALLISPVRWRSIFKPLYAEYFNLLHRAGKKVFFHSDGMILDIIPDLIEIGADVLNCQIDCMDINELGRNFGGRIVFWGEPDRQRVMPFGTAAEVRAEVRKLCDNLALNSRGLIAQLYWGIDVPTENVMAAFEEYGRTG
ncbi:MAG: hypothetical protein JW957_07350 [Candidatus Omnitrophica bacterium]|nr:hypothetical protein [Candidatus Omnitrophota bacterium]